MRRKDRETFVPFLPALITTLFFATMFLYVFRNFSAVKIHLQPANFNHLSSNNLQFNYLIKEETLSLFSSVKYPELESVLLPDWEILLIASPDNPLSSDSVDQYIQYVCIFQNNVTSAVKFTGVLDSSKRATFKCVVPNSVRRFKPLLTPVVRKLSKLNEDLIDESRKEIFRWSFLAYEALSTEKDVILFVKGVNNRQGMNRSPEDLRCVFDNGVDYSVKTEVTSSSQEVFRCNHPNEIEKRRLFAEGSRKIKISIEITVGRRVIVPSVTYYEPKNIVEEKEAKGKSLLCASTMVHNVGKFLKEWVVYHSNIGVEKFILYDNDSDDDLQKVVQELVDGQYSVRTFLWPWPKTQEAGFSHSAIHGQDSCTWMMFTDVDEFVYAPSWRNSSYPSPDMLSAVLPPITPSLPPPSLSSDYLSRPIGQVSVRCLEFGPSNQKSHPIAGVTQGYTCRRRGENRHKSIVLLDVIDDSLRNVIHHFQLKEGYRTRTMSLQEGLVNHYKYQAWSEFKVKFRRRVSAYVVDWKQGVNPTSQDRTPGLGFEAIEPEGWATKFCEMNDTRIKVTTHRWFSLDSTSESKMAWQD